MASKSQRGKKFKKLSKKRILGNKRYNEMLENVDGALINEAEEQFKKQFTGPSQYFHQKAITLALSKNDEDFLSKEHIESIYAVLPAWGMHRMGPNKTKVPDFPIFEKSIQDLDKEGIFENLRKIKIEEADFSKLEDLKKAFRSIEGSMSGAKLVANSKVLAHILPNLIAPIDRAYTLKFFGYSYPVSKDPLNSLYMEKQLELFITLSQSMSKIAQKIVEKGLNKGILAKVVDNLIILGAPKKKKKKV